MKSHYKKQTTLRSSDDSKYQVKYAFTLRSNVKRWPSPKDYEDFMSYIIEDALKFDIVDYVYEVGNLNRSNVQSGKLHVHGVLIGPAGLPYLKPQIQGTGMNIRLRMLSPGDEWNRYCHKQDPIVIDEYIIAHFWDMDKEDFDFENHVRYSKPRTLLVGEGVYPPDDRMHSSASA